MSFKSDNWLTKAIGLPSVLGLAVFIAGVGNVQIAKAEAVKGASASYGLTEGESNNALNIQAKDSQGRRWYIVVLKEPALAMYRGTDSRFAAPTKNEQGRLDVRSAPALSYVSHLQSEQASFLARASTNAGRSLAPVDPRYQFQHAINGMVINLNDDEMVVVAQDPSVDFVEEHREYELSTDAGPTWIGAPSIWSGTSTLSGLATRGEGVVIGVIDSGANIGSPSFAATDMDGYTHTNPLGTNNYLGLCDPSYPGHDPARDICTSKMIGGYDFTVDPAPSVGIDGPGFEDEGGHGSHTASTAGGNRRLATQFGVTIPISGVAPRANLIIYNGCYQPAPGVSGGCPTAATSASVNQAVADGIVDVLTYSISGGSSPWTETTSLAFLGAHNAGITITASGGNSGPGASTVAHLEPWLLTVAASTHDRAFFGNTLTGNSPTNGSFIVGMKPGSNPPFLTASLPAGTPVILSPQFNSPTHDDACAVTHGAYPANTFVRNGVPGIAVVRWGNNLGTSACGTIDRANNAGTNGGAAAVLFVPDTSLNAGAGGSVPAFVAEFVGQHAALLAALTVDPVTTTGNVAFPGAAFSGQGDVMAGFSSRGPNPFALLKPDLTGPGVNILAAYNRYIVNFTTPPGVLNTALNGNVASISGTSMSTPHLAGSAALLKALNRGWTPMQVKSALITTTIQGGITKENATTPADPFDRGTGRVDLTKAAKAGLVLDETALNFANANPATGGDPSTLNLPSFQSNDCIGTCTFTRTVKSTRSNPVTWVATVEGLPAGSASVSVPNFNLVNGGTQTFTLNINSMMLPIGQHAFGQLVFTPNNAAIPIARMGIAVRPSIPDIDVTPTSITTTVAAGGTVSRLLTIRNTGNPTILWSYDGAGTGPSTIISTVNNAANGFTTGYFSNQTPAPGGMYYAEDFTPASNGTLSSLRFEGFMTGSPTQNLDVRATALRFEIYQDTGGATPVPTGNPEQAPTPTGQIYACSRAPNGVGVSLTGSGNAFFTLDLIAAAADGCPAAPVLAAGTRYWVLPIPVYPGNNAERRWVWFRSTTTQGALAKRISPLLLGGLTASWSDFASTAPALSALTFTAVAQVQCGAPWLTSSVASGSLGINGSQNTNLVFNASALAVGTYTAIACISSNGTDLDEPSVVVPVTLNVVAANTNPSAASAATPSTAGPGQTSLLTVDVVPGNSPPSTGITVTANLSSIGGSSTQTLFDNGSNGDVLAGDNRFSYLATVALGTTSGTKTMAASVLDAELRTASTNISLTVPAPTLPTSVRTASPNSLPVGASTLLTVRVTPGAFPTSTGIAVSANLSTIGGSANQAFFDNGTNGDLVAADNTFSYTAVIAPGTIAEAKTLAVTLTDAQARTAAAGSIALTVVAATNPSAVGTSNPPAVNRGSSAVLSYTVTRGINPTSTGVTVSGNLSSIGGSAIQTFYDDGSHGDATPNDFTYTYTYAVPANATPGAASLPASVSDAQGRSGTGSINLSINPPTNPSGTGMASPSPVLRGASTLFTVATSAGASPVSTGIAATVDLSAIGGLSNQTMYDNGSNGDVTAGDGTFSYSYLVPGNSATGAQVLLATVSDAQSRSSVANINLNVTPPTNPTGTGLAVFESVVPGATTRLQVTTTAGISPTSTAITVTADLTAIGGSASQVLNDNGNNGDLVAGDGIYSHNYTVPAGTAFNSYILPISVGDAQSRSSTTTIPLDVRQVDIFMNGFE